MNRYGLGMPAVALTAMLVSAVPSALGAETLATVSARPGVTQRFLLLKPEKPTAAVVLFAGGEGVLALHGPEDAPVIGKEKYNFLVRTRERFAARGFVVAVPDAPSDHQDRDGMLHGFRASTEHARDIGAVVERVSDNGRLPVWLVGTSRGTESATNVGNKITGVVLTSSITVKNRGGPDVLSMDLERLRVPVFVVAHLKDACKVSPPDGADRIVRRMTHSPRAEFRMMGGGKPPQSGPCEALAPHGFHGVEAETVNAIVNFIKSATPPEH
jgi:pimeloyl-ACP methyl ester carboxylesterase